MIKTKLITTAKKMTVYPENKEQARSEYCTRVNR